jgi:hypothetical protein
MMERANRPDAIARAAAQSRYARPPLLQGIHRTLNFGRRIS